MRCLSNHEPRFLSAVIGQTSVDPTLMQLMLTLASCRLVPIIKHSFYHSFNIRLSEIIQLLILLIQSVMDLVAKSTSADRLGLNDTYTTVCRLRSSGLGGGGVQRSETDCAQT